MFVQKEYSDSKKGTNLTHEEIANACESLSYRDKFRLAQLLLQLGRKQEEEEYPKPRKASGIDEPDQIAYVTERLLKLKPAKLVSLSNSISAMFQFQGGISESDKDAIVAKLQRQKIIVVSETGRISYPDSQ